MKKFITAIFYVFINFFLIGLIGVSYLIYINVKELPDYNQIANYNPPIVTRFYASDGKLLEEYAKEYRLFVPINAIPKQLQYAFIAAEDKNFYEHSGIDFSGILRAGIQNIINISRNKKNLVGGSTITQQVVKNFLLTNEKTISRKIKEAVLSFRITNVYTKDKILELYLNQIYLGSGAYGVASASLAYFNKSINELTIEESALLAAMPKAPSSFSPKKFYDKALIRRNWVLERMREEEFITEDEFKNSIKQPITLRTKSPEQTVKADFFAEAVRRRVAEKYSPKSLYEGGLYIRTTLDPKLQKIAEKALRTGLVTYDKRRGYKNVVTNVKTPESYKETLEKYETTEKIEGWEYAIIKSIDSDKLNITLLNDKNSTIPQSEMTWALGSKQSIKSKFNIGDVIITENIGKHHTLRQIPKVNGGIVVMDPHLGKVLAMVGGFDFRTSKYNRVDQAMRQPGSAFKTFVYLSALENGFTPSSIIDDSPIAMSQGPGLPLWRPRNYHRDFLGPTTLRRGLELSRNTMTVNLSQMLGIHKVVQVAQRFDICKNPKPMFSMVLGAMETNLLNMTTAYATILNGGKKVTPSLIERIQDRNGKIIFTHDNRNCNGCNLSAGQYYNIISNNENVLPKVIEDSERITDEQTAYQIISILQGAVEHTVTGRSIRALGKTLAGKTGTTNESKDTWYIGFSPDLVVGTFVGFDEPKSLGAKDSGATIAQPIFVEFMKEALKDTIDIPFRIPPGISLVKINYETGKPSMAPSGTIYESFKTGTEPDLVDSSTIKNQEEPKTKTLEQDNNDESTFYLKEIY